MPPKKPPLPAAINIRLKRDEATAITADVQAIRQGADVPLTVSGYAKHALLSYARLRRLEVLVQSASKGLAGEDVSKWAREVLAEVAP